MSVSKTIYTKDKVDELLSEIKGSSTTSISDLKTELQANIDKKQDKLTFDGSYSSSNPVATKTTVTNAINALDVSDTAVEGQFVTSVKETDGKISVTRSEITKANVGLGNVVNAGQDSTPISGSSNYITSGGVKSYVDSAISGVSQFKYEVVSSLPTASASTMGKIYLVSHSHGSTDTYDEYITIQSGSSYSWEKLGNTDIDLSGYQKSLTATQLNAVNSGITSAKVSTYDGYASGKQNALSTSQLAAVNSGITSDAVEKIDKSVLTSYDDDAGTITFTIN